MALTKILITQAATIALLLWAGTGAVDAHAIVVESSPKNGESSSTPPEKVVLRFNAKIEKGMTDLRLTYDNGSPLPLRYRAEDGNESPDQLIITLPPLGAGKYVLRYKVLATDGHSTIGELRFSVTENAGR